MEEESREGHSTRRTLCGAFFGVVVDASERREHSGVSEPARNQAEVIAGHQQQEQGYRQAYAQRQGSDSALGLAAVGNQEKQRRPQAGEDQEHEYDDDDFHCRR